MHMRFFTSFPHQNINILFFIFLFYSQFSPVFIIRTPYLFFRIRVYPKVIHISSNEIMIKNI